VLEVDVDVRGLVALARHEALEKHAHARGIHLRDAERIAHHGVRRRSPALAENAARSREAHHVVHRKKKRLVAKLADERELVLDELADLRRHARREAPAQPFLGQLSEPRGGRMAFGDELGRILVPQLIQ
jgi:hypothetical protein